MSKNTDTQIHKPKNMLNSVSERELNLSMLFIENNIALKNIDHAHLLIGVEKPTVSLESAAWVMTQPKKKVCHYEIYSPYCNRTAESGNRFSGQVGVNPESISMQLLLLHSCYPSTASLSFIDVTVAYTSRYLKTSSGWIWVLSTAKTGMWREYRMRWPLQQITLRHINHNLNKLTVMNIPCIQ